VQNRPINDHAAYILHICAAYFAKFCIFSHVFCLKKFYIF